MIRLRASLIGFCLFLSLVPRASAQRLIPPYDLWTDDVLSQIKDRSTLDYSPGQQTCSLGTCYAEVYFTSTTSASYFDAKPPYDEHTGEKIRIHGYLAYPPFGGPFPAVVIAHGHGGQADLYLAQLVALQGFVVLAIDGPQAGKSTGGPVDDVQAWISVDKGPQYGYLYHYAYACMRGLTLLEALAAQPGNTYGIDSTKLGALGISMGGIVTTYMNSVDSRMGAALVISSAGNWQHVLRIPNSWLYHDIYTGTRDVPYNGSDPLNSIEDIDFDSTTVTFLDYFDPIRYAVGQYGPVMTVIGTHDEYFPLPNANLMELASISTGLHANFESRLWLVPNGIHDLSNVGLLGLTTGLKQWLDYCFGKRQRPLVSPTIAMTQTADGLRFAITVADTAARLSGASAQLYAATRVDSTVTPDADFTAYTATFDGSLFAVTIPAGANSASGDAYTAQNVIYYVTITDSFGLPVSSLVYKGSLVMDLSSGFVPAVEHSPADTVSVPLPPSPVDALRTETSSVPVLSDNSYQGMSLSNPTDSPMSVRVEARTPDGRIAAATALTNPVFMTIAPRTERIFLAYEWLGVGALQFSGSFQIGWNDARGSSLAFRGKDTPAQLDGIGPMPATDTTLWLPLVPSIQPNVSRKLKFFSSNSSAASVTLTYRTSYGNNVTSGVVTQVTVPASGSAELPLTVGTGDTQVASVQIDSPVPISARMEVNPGYDSWSVDALPTPAATSFFQPHAEWNGTYKTYFTVLNTSSSTATQVVTFKWHSPSVQTINPDFKIQLTKGQAVTLQLEQMFQPKSSNAKGTGWVEAQVTGGEVLIEALAYDSTHYAIAASPVAGSLSGTLSMPFFVENDGYWTGLAIANPGSSTLTANIVAYDENGKVLGQYSPTLLPGTNKVQLVHEWMKDSSPPFPTSSTGQIVITTSAPLSLLAYFGTNDGASLAAIPFH